VLVDVALRDRGVEHLIVTGCTTSICVESTVRDAMFRDYTCLVVEDCVAEPLGADMPRTNHEASLLNIEALLGWVASSDAVIAAFDEGALDQALDEPVRVTGADGH
jgi:ureidoacrylate peracid hydrolase